jgi:hypothetical protein
MENKDDLFNLRERIDKAINYAVRFGGIGGDHHKAWVIDQMVRALTGCPTVMLVGHAESGAAYDYSAQGESEEYTKLVKEACDGDLGPDTYTWELGIAP